MYYIIYLYIIALYINFIILNRIVNPRVQYLIYKFSYNLHTYLLIYSLTV